MLSEALNVSIPSCSEAARGLFVLPQGGGIFTDIAISPGPSLRQFPSRDAIRAGLNLPDKEIRSNFSLSTSLLLPAKGGRHGHFCHTLYVAIEIGLYLPTKAFCLRGRAYSL